jgi:hypothetical protein
VEWGVVGRRASIASGRSPTYIIKATPSVSKDARHRRRA